jgi:hypothetical protein
MNMPGIARLETDPVDIMSENEASITVTGCLDVAPQPRLVVALVPVCAQCHRVRDDGEWIPMDLYISGHPDADWTHGFCPECLRALYPEVAEIVLQEVTQRIAPKVWPDPRS